MANEENANKVAQGCVVGCFSIFVIVVVGFILSAMIGNNKHPSTSTGQSRPIRTQTVNQEELREAVRITEERIKAAGPATLERFNQIRPGWTYEQVKYLMDGDTGEVMTQSAVAGTTFWNIRWVGGRGNMVITFQDNVVISKAQMLLP